ncbi:hypothetical protein EDD27_9297 [Nonomuraea polychroma]|uniref:Uncharacterized protein n=1 Tax=Nonomuraea polychroma TaxID=46176 RepID=A0A438ML10_9ACTN|nr:hypothetical protein [Nonomuraea polychroma]RVX46417.1 hypothetical protein EDD27_9297 [Nonomuraea polychroma]
MLWTGPADIVERFLAVPASGVHEREEQLRAGVVQRGEAHLVYHEVVAEQVLDHAADGVVGQTPIERVSTRSAAVK